MKKILIGLVLMFATTVWGASSEALLKNSTKLTGSAPNKCAIKANIAGWVMEGRKNGMTKEAWLVQNPIDPVELEPDVLAFATKLVDEAFEWAQDYRAFPAHVYNECAVGRF